MAYGVMADLHAHNWRTFGKTNADGVNSRLRHILDEVVRCAKEVSARRGTMIYIAGDVFHSRGTITPSVLNPVRDTLRHCFERYDVSFSIIPGNHDLESKETSALSSAVEGLRCHYVDVANAPVFDASDKTAMVPWHNTREGLLDAVERLRHFIEESGEEPADYTLMLHTGIAGVVLGADAHAFTPSELANLGFGDVMCGHYHAHKSFTVPFDGERDVRVVSIGTPAHHVWGDVGTKSGFIIVDEGDHEFFESEAPKFVDFDPEREISADLYEGNYVRIRNLDLDRAELDEIKLEIERFGADSVVVHVAPKSSVVERSDSVTTSVVPKNEEVIVSWVDNADVGDIAEEVKAGALKTLRAAETME